MSDLMFDVTGNVSQTGFVMHRIKADNREDAWEKYLRAYPGRECSLVKLSEQRIYRGDGS